MRCPIIGAVFAAALGLSGCNTTDLAALINSSDSNPECYKDVRVQVTPMMLFGYVIPIIAGTYVKTCHPEKASGAQPTFINPGQIVVPVGGAAVKTSP